MSYQSLVSLKLPDLSSGIADGVSFMTRNINTKLNIANASTNGAKITAKMIVSSMV